MESLYRELVRLCEAGVPFSLGTVIHTAGSTPQKPGARAVFLPDGEVLGTLGGGCMEAEARRRGLRLLRGGAPELLELHLNDDFGWDDGLICGGTAQIFLQPRPEGQTEVFRAAAELRERRGRGALVLVVAGPPEAVGRTCLVPEEEPSIGAAGPPELQEALEATARSLLREGRETPRRVSLADPAATLYVEPLLPPPVCFIAGAGHLGAALCHYAARLGFEVAVADDRPALCSPERLPEARHRLVGDIVESVRRWPMTRETYVVIVTRGHRHDAVVLREVVRAPVAYLGMIGSRRKILTIYDEFLAEGLATPEELARIHAPLGLDIGALSVEEIALSIAAELVLVRRKGARSGGASADGGAGDGDSPGGGGVPADGGAEAALALRLRERDTHGRPLAERLPRRSGARRSGAS